MLKATDSSLNMARKGTPNLYLAANFLKPGAKFQAFLSSYAVMRIVDDLVDDGRAAGEMSEERKTEISAHLDQFAKLFDTEFSLLESLMPPDLRKSIKQFAIPSWPFTFLAKSMKFDLHNDRFESMEQFLSYSEGAAVSPAAIFMHLAGSTETEPGQFAIPKFDIKEAARPLALFSYLVHILRDFKKDFSSGAKPLIYFDMTSCEKFYVTEDMMAEIVASGTQPLKFTKLVQYLFSLVTKYQVASRRMIDSLQSELPTDGLFSLNLIYELYSAVAAKFTESGYNLITGDFELSHDNILMAGMRAAETSGTDPDPVSEKLKQIITTQR